MHMMRHDPYVEGWCPFCNLSAAPEEPALVLSPGTAIRNSGGAWLHQQEHGNDPLVLHKDCAAQWFERMFERVGSLAENTQDSECEADA